MRFTSLFTTCLLAPIVSSTNILLGLPQTAPAVIPNWNPSSIASTTRATLSTLSSEYTALLRTDNTFSFRNVSAGSYLLDVHCGSHVFAPLRVDIDDKGDVEVWGTFRGNEWENKGEVVGVRDVAGYKTFDVRVLSEKNYYVERTGFSPLSILKNPMILIAGVSMILVFGMPYLMENMDPELKEEFEARQKTSPLTGGPVHQNPLQNFDAAAWLAGSGPKKTDPADAPVTR